MIVSARQNDFNFSVFADLLGFFCALQSVKSAENGVRSTKTSSEWQCCGQKYLVIQRGQRGMTGQVQMDRKVTVTEITRRYSERCAEELL